MTRSITKAIITAAGRGTRFLPASKAFQKELIPVMQKPQLQWVIEEALESGISDIAIVVREGVDTFQRYLDDNKVLWDFLRENGKEELMDSWVRIKEEANITLFEQKDSDPYGNGVPFIVARKFTEDKPVAAMWGDDIMVHIDKSEPTCLKQMINYYEKYKPVAVMSTTKVSCNEISRYASYEYFEDKIASVPYQAKRIIEKPKPEEAPSLMANACRFILTVDVFEELNKKIKGKGGEIWLADAIERVIRRGKIVMAPPWAGSIWVPVGDPVNWLKANVVVALNDKLYRKDMKRVIRNISNLGLVNFASCENKTCQS